jgi:hypothetical protein
VLSGIVLKKMSKETRSFMQAEISSDCNLIGWKSSGKPSADLSRPAWENRESALDEEVNDR